MMTIKSIIVHVGAAPGCNRRLLLATQVADRFGAALIGLGAEIWDATVGLGEPLLIEAVREQVALELSAAEAHFRQSTAGRANVEWLREEGFPAQRLALHARGADLVVTSRPAREDTALQTPKLCELIIEAGAPVLVAADGAAPFSGQRVVVAWKDTREGRRALTDALPFLKSAQKVVVVAVEGETETRDARPDGLTEVAQRLARHGVTAVIERAPKGHGSVTEAIEDAAGRHGADLIVAGAYGRSHLREWWLGGVTEDLVVSCAKFVLFSH